MTQEIIPAYSTFQKDIDLTLYHAFSELVVQTAQDGEARILYRQLEARQIWQEDQNVSSYFEAYSLRYPGEVLERFEEKLGTDIRILRALALALGYTRRCQADTMFVGNQRNDFIQKLRRTAGTDVYLQGALYLLETDAFRRRTRLDELAAREYARTEEALFVLSLFNDPETGYQAMRPQLTRLFGPERTISMARDFGVLEWFIRFYAEEAKRYRGKNDLVLRTLMKLPYMNMKPDSREFSVLHTAGYSMEEITMANSLAVWADRIPDRLSSKGIVAEKIAVACVRMLLNGPDGQPEEIYAYISWLFQVYKKFEVRYEGYQDLWAAIQTGLAPTAPQTILWMNQTIKRQFPYRFDVFDPRYDILANELSNEEYAELFTMQMLRSRAAIPLRRWLTRYQALTGVEYIEYFNKRHWLTLRSFVLLVERKEINLWQFFEQHKGDGARAHPLELLEEYALKISSWRCFRFAQKLFSQYTFSQLQEIFGDNFYFHQKFVKKESYYNKKVHVGLSNILDSEFVRRKPTKRSHGEVVGAAVVDSELHCKVIQGEKAAAGVKALLVLTVAALHFTVVARRIRPDELVADTQVGGGGLKQSGEIPLAVGETIGKFKAIIRLDTFHADSTARIPLEQLFQKIRRGIGGLLRVSSQEAQACELINSSVLVQAQLRVCDTAAGDHLHIYLDPLAGIGHLLVGLWLAGRFLLFR